MHMHACDLWGVYPLAKKRYTSQTSHTKGFHGNAAPSERYCVTRSNGIPTHLVTPMPLNRVVPPRVEP